MFGSKFTVYTDHRPLVSLIKKRLDEVSIQRILRNFIKCQDFDLHVEYVYGSKTILTDTLSRYPTSTPDETDVSEAAATAYQIRAIQTASIQDAQYNIPEQRIHDSAEMDATYTALKTVIMRGSQNQRKTRTPVLQITGTRVTTFICLMTISSCMGPGSW